MPGVPAGVVMDVDWSWGWGPSNAVVNNALRRQLRLGHRPHPRSASAAWRSCGTSCGVMTEQHRRTPSTSGRGREPASSLCSSPTSRCSMDRRAVGPWGRRPTPGDCSGEPAVVCVGTYGVAFQIARRTTARPSGPSSGERNDDMTDIPAEQYEAPRGRRGTSTPTRVAGAARGRDAGPRGRAGRGGGGEVTRTGDAAVSWALQRHFLADRACARRSSTTVFDIGAGAPSAIAARGTPAATKHRGPAGRGAQVPRDCPRSSGPAVASRPHRLQPPAPGCAARPTGHTPATIRHRGHRHRQPGVGQDPPRLVGDRERRTGVDPRPGLLRPLPATAVPRCTTCGPASTTLTSSEMQSPAEREAVARHPRRRHLRSEDAGSPSRVSRRSWGTGAAMPTATTARPR